MAGGSSGCVLARRTLPLVEAADERARQVSALSVMLHVECDNLGAICFYEAARFTRASEHPRYRQFARAISIDPDSHYLYERPVRNVH